MDQAILLIMAIRNCTSAYSTWIQLVKEIGGNALSYKNVGKRIIKLWQSGMLKEVKLNVQNIHGRKDYKLTMEGMKLIASFAITHPEEIKNILQYIDRFRLDKPLFGEYMLDKFASCIEAINEYGKYANLYDIEYRKYLDTNIQDPTAHLERIGEAIEVNMKYTQKHRKKINVWMKLMNKYFDKKKPT